MGKVSTQTVDCCLCLPFFVQETLAGQASTRLIGHSGRGIVRVVGIRSSRCRESAAQIMDIHGARVGHVKAYGMQDVIANWRMIRFLSSNREIWMMRCLMKNYMESSKKMQ